VGKSDFEETHRWRKTQRSVVVCLLGFLKKIDVTLNTVVRNFLRFTILHNITQ
jgi:hypothetical protein